MSMGSFAVFGSLGITPAGDKFSAYAEPENNRKKAKRTSANLAIYGASHVPGVPGPGLSVPGLAVSPPELIVFPGLFPDVPGA